MALLQEKYLYIIEDMDSKEAFKPSSSGCRMRICIYICVCIINTCVFVRVRVRVCVEGAADTAVKFMGCKDAIQAEFVWLSYVYIYVYMYY